MSLYDDPSLFTARGALIVDGRGNRNLAPGDVICFWSRPNATPFYRNAALVNGALESPAYALPPYTQLTLEEVLEPPWTVTLRR